MVSNCDFSNFVCGIFSLMEVNDYSKKHFINFNDIFRNLDDSFLWDITFFKCYNFYRLMYVINIEKN